MKAATKDGAASETGLKVHIKMIQSAEKGIGEIPLNKIVDFRILEEVRREVTR
jgi:hypothetical protein